MSDRKEDLEIISLPGDQTFKFVQSPPESILYLQNNNEPILEISHDGTVTVHKYGAEKEAACLFYEFLQFEGQTLYQKIEALEEEIKILKKEKKI